jgi:hypothetical protein
MPPKTAKSAMLRAATTSPEAIVDFVGPTLQRHLTGNLDLPAGR